VSDANVVKLVQPGSFADPLTEVLRNGARALLAQAVEAEACPAASVRVWHITSRGWDPWTERPLPEAAAT
jgi:putative transposase